MNTTLLPKWLVALLCSWVLTGTLAAQNELNDHIARASDKRNAEDLTGAIAEYTQAIKLAPKMFSLYRDRAAVEHAKGDLDAALADLDRAVVLDPKDAETHSERAVVKGAKNDVDGAIADHTRALELDPTLGQAYSDRGLDKLSKGDLQGAAEDCDKGVALDAASPDAFRDRGIVHQAQQHWQQALADYRRYCELTGGWGDYMRFYICLIRARLAQADEGRQELAAHVAEIPKTGEEAWARTVAEFLMGRVAEADFLKLAASPDENKDRGQHCEAYYFAGMKALAAGNKTEAAEDFRKCLATDKQTFTEYEFAKAELKALTP